MFILFLVRFGLLSGHLLEEKKAAHSVDHMFSFVILFISRFGFEGWIWVLTASVPGLVYFFNFIENHDYYITWSGTSTVFSCLSKISIISM